MVFHTVDTGFLAYNIVNAATEAKTLSALSVSPNPAGEWTRISMPGHIFKNGNVRLSDVYGRLVRQQKFQGESVVLRRNNLPAGIYAAEVFECDKRVGFIRIIWP